MDGIRFDDSLHCQPGLSPSETKPGIKATYNAIVRINLTLPELFATRFFRCTAPSFCAIISIRLAFAIALPLVV